MSVPSLIQGQYFDVGVFWPTNSSTPVVLCGLTTRNFTHQFNTSDQFVRDCADPAAKPFRVVNVTGEQFDIAGTGLFNRQQAGLLRSIAGKSLVYRFIMAEDAEDPVDSGYYEGKFVCSNLQYEAADGANVGVQLTFVSDGQVLWYPTAALTVLDPLDVAPKTVARNTAWTGAVTGKTTGSTLTAASSDSTSLTVSGSNVSGTFTTAGAKTITLTETLSGAPNSPKVTQVGINVTAA